MSIRMEKSDIYSFTVSNYGDFFFFSDKNNNHPITLKVSQQFINGFLYALWFAEEKNPLQIATDGKIPDERYFESLKIARIDTFDNKAYSPDYSIYGDAHMWISEDKLKDRVKKYNDYYMKFLSSISKKANYPFTAVLNVYNYEESYDFVLQFESVDFLVGFRTLTAWNKGTYNQLSHINDFEQVHFNNKLCYTSIKHSIISDFLKIEKLLENYLFADLTKIVMEYMQETCLYYSKQMHTKKKIYYNRFIQCLTPCNTGQQICEACKAESGSVNQPFEISIKLEVATDTLHPLPLSHSQRFGKNNPRS